MHIQIFIYPGFTALDAIGPYEVLSRLPQARVRFVAPEAGNVTADTGFLNLRAEAALSADDVPDLLILPGSPHDDRVRANPPLMALIARLVDASPRVATVCTGSLILAATGALKGLPAVTHWADMETLAELGARPVEQRWLSHGKFMIAAGVSAGIDMSLALAAEMGGEAMAQCIQLGIEYDPQPPFDCGSVRSAPEAIVAATRAAMDARNSALA